jgi:hypothetical protein
MQEEIESVAAVQGRKHQSTGINARANSSLKGDSPLPCEQTKIFEEEMDILANESIFIKLDKKNENRTRGKTSNGHDYEGYLKQSSPFESQSNFQMVPTYQ